MMNPEERGIEAFRLVVLSEITGLRKLVILTMSIIIILVLLNIGTNAFRIYLIEERVHPMQQELDSLYKELDYDCNHKGTDSRLQCRLRSARKQAVDESHGN